MPNLAGLRWALVAAIAGALSPPDAAAVQPPLAWEMVEHDTPLVVWVNRGETVRVRIRNVGSATWSEETGDHLSYRWVTPAGKVIGEGVRTSFASPVRPGEEVELEANLRGPAKGGAWVIQWEMVREQVRWYGPPASGEEVRASVRAMWRCAVLQALFAAATVALAALVRWRRPRDASPLWYALAPVPLVWAHLAVVLSVFTFAELVDRPLRGSAGGIAISGAAALALLVLTASERWRAWAAFAVTALVALVSLADLVYLRYFGSVVPLVAVAGIGQIGQVEGSIRALLSGADTALLVTVAAGLGFAVVWPRREPRAGSRRGRLVAGGVLAAAGLAAALPALLTLGKALADPRMSTQVFSEEMLVSRWGVLNVHLFDIGRTVREWWALDTLSEAEEKAVAERLAARAARLRPSPHFGAARGANLVLIQVESLQQWVIGARVGDAEIMPFLSALRRRALSFPYVFDQTEQGRSSDGEFAALNSHYPLTKGAVAFRRADNHFVALPGVLEQAGYATMSAHPFERGFWNRAVLHPRYGFDRMLFRRELGPGEVIGWGLADDVFFTRIAPELPKLRRPFFAMLITLGLHHPFDLFPDRHKKLDVGPLTGTPLGNYVHAMHYFDASVARLVARLEAAGLLRDTVVALYGDHEAGLGAPRELREMAGVARWTTSTNVLLRRVPFFVLLPGGAPAGERPTPGGHADIAPTLLDLLGVERPQAFMGTSLLGGRPFPVLVHGGSAVGGGVLFVARGDRVPEGGVCYSFPVPEPLPRSACDALAAEAAAERELSRLVVEHDLAR